MDNRETKPTRDTIDQLGRIACHKLTRTNSTSISSTIQDRALEILQGFFRSPLYQQSDIRVHIDSGSTHQNSFLLKALTGLPGAPSSDGCTLLTTQLLDGKYRIGHISGGTKQQREATRTALNQISFLVAQENSEKWEYFAKHDTLTGLMNRFGFVDLLTQVVTPDRDCVAMCFDFNKFKVINDTYGHSIGDDALRLFAGVCREICQIHGGTIARTGGDEFMGLFLECRVDTGAKIAQEMQSVLLSQFTPQNTNHTTTDTVVGIKNIPFTVSIGVTDTQQQSGDTIQKIGITPLQSFISRLLHRADKAADMAKNYPKLQYVYIWDASCNIDHTLSDSNKRLRTLVESLLRGMRNDNKAHDILTNDIFELLIQNLNFIESKHTLWILLEHMIMLLTADTDDDGRLR